MKKPRTSYAYSLKVTKCREGDFPYQNEVLSSPDAVYRFSQSIIEEDREVFLTLFLNSRNKLVAINVQPGTLDQTAVYPREVAKQALLSGGNSVILVHSHPSGSLQPSQADRELTRLLKEALMLIHVSVKDHVIVSEEGFYSFAEYNHI